MWKSRIDTAVRDFQPLKKQFVPWTFFLGGGGRKGAGEKGGGGGCFISLSLVGNKNVENKIILFTGWGGIIKKL